MMNWLETNTLSGLKRKTNRNVVYYRSFEIWRQGNFYPRLPVFVLLSDLATCMPKGCFCSRAVQRFQCLIYCVANKKLVFLTVTMVANDDSLFIRLKMVRRRLIESQRKSILYVPRPFLRLFEWAASDFQRHAPNVIGNGFQSRQHSRNAFTI